MAIREELNARLADIYKLAEVNQLPINTDGEEGCPPCGTISEEEACVGCPFRLRALGVEI